MAAWSPETEQSRLGAERNKPRFVLKSPPAVSTTLFRPTPVPRDRHWPHSPFTDSTEPAFVGG